MYAMVVGNECDMVHQRGPVLKRAKDVKEAFSGVNILNNSPATQYLTRFNNCQHFWLSNTRHLYTQT